jgi:hypothetical protein
MTTRFQPPNNPLSEHTPDAETAQIRRGIGTRSIGDLLRHWQAFALLVLVGAGTVYAAWHLIAWGWPVADVLFWSAVVLGLTGAGAVWVVLRMRQDFWQFGAIKQYNAVKLDAYRDHWATLQTQGDHYARRWYREAKKPGVVIGGDQVKAATAAAQSAQADAAAARQEAAQIAAAFAALQQQAERAVVRIAAAGEPPKARVQPAERETTELPTSPPMPAPRRVAYVGTDEEAVMTVVFSGRAPSLAYFKAQGWARPRWETSIAILKHAGILTEQGRGKGLGMTADFAAMVQNAPADKKHDVVEMFLARDHSPTPRTPAHSE